MTPRPSESYKETQSPHNATKNTALDGAPGDRLTSEEEGGPIAAAPLPADPLLELYQEAAEEDLRQRLKVYRRLDTMERHKHKKAGHAGALVARLEIPRRHWPAVHEAVIKNGIPIRTERLPRHAVTPIVALTSQSGALRLGVTLQALQAPEGRP